jgi:hypothetical protein
MAQVEWRKIKRCTYLNPSKRKIMKLTKKLVVAVFVIASMMVLQATHIYADDGTLNTMVGLYQQSLGLYQKALDETTDPALRATIQQEMNEVRTTINDLNTPGSPVIDPYNQGQQPTNAGQNGSSHSSGNSNNGPWCTGSCSGKAI